MPPRPPIKDAATIILKRELDGETALLMGKRGAGAVFMPSKFVFPGGAVDRTDEISPPRPLQAKQAHNLALWSNCSASSLAACAIRELWEETGLMLAHPAAWPDAPAPWADFAARGMRPNFAALRYVFRAITPPGRNRRFDARFFMADAASLANDPDDFCAAEDELSALQWVPLSRLHSLDMPQITQLVLKLLRPQLLGADGPDPVYLSHGDGAKLLPHG